MKMKIFALIMAILCLTMLFAACSKDDACEEHVDEDKNAKCDVCEAELDCEEHNDEDADYVCDICGDKFNVTAKCATHTDADGDKKCDVCKSDFVACTDHKDNDANKICDACGASIVAITQLEKPVVEERVDMVVNQIPTDALISDFYQTTMPAPETAAGLIKNYDETVQEGAFAYFVDGYGTKKVIDTKTGATIFETANTDATILLDNYWFTVEVHSYVDDPITLDRISNSYSRTYYTYTGANFASLSWTSAEGTPDFDANGDSWYKYHTENAKTDIALYDDERYDAILISDTLYVIDCVKNVCATTTTMNLFVDRPSFTVYNADFGIVDDGNTLYFYDLSAWIKCTGSYTIPGFAPSASYWLLDNGKLLVQYFVNLSDNATSYDVLESGSKYDIVYTIVDLATAEAKNVEFGYYIYDLRAIADDDTMYNTEIDLNRVLVYPIVNDQVDYNADMVLLVDSDLNIKISETEAFGDVNYFALVANNRFLVEKFYANGQYRRDLVNEKGEAVAYVPLTAVVYETYIEFEGKYYDFDMKLILDPEEKQVNLYAQCEQFLLFSKFDELTYQTRYFYFDTATAQLSEIMNTFDNLVCDEFGYILVTNHYDYTTGHYVRGIKVYNADNTLIAEKANFSFNYSDYGYGANGYYIGGTQYSDVLPSVYEQWLLK